MAVAELFVLEISVCLRWIILAKVKIGCSCWGILLNGLLNVRIIVLGSLWRLLVLESCLLDKWGFYLLGLGYILKLLSLANYLRSSYLNIKSFLLEIFLLNSLVVKIARVLSTLCKMVVEWQVHSEVGSSKTMGKGKLVKIGDRNVSKIVYSNQWECNSM